jgi:hypothetical protein
MGKEGEPPSSGSSARHGQDRVVSELECARPCAGLCRGLRRRFRRLASSAALFLDRLFRCGLLSRYRIDGQSLKSVAARLADVSPGLVALTDSKLRFRPEHFGPCGHHRYGLGAGRSEGAQPGGLVLPQPPAR